MNSIQVATFNINYICKGHGCPNAEKVANTIANCGADIVCLQESNAKWEEFLLSSSGGSQQLLQSIYLHIRFHNHWHDWGGFAVLSKYPINDWQVLAETDKWWYPAGLVTVQLPKAGTRGDKDNDDDKSHHSWLLQLLIVHLRAPVKFSTKPYWWGGHANWIGGYFSKQVKARRLDEIQTFASALKPNLPSVVVGDFNERGSSSPCVRYLEDQLDMKNLPKKSIAGRCYTKNSWSFEVGGLTLLSFDYDHVVYSQRYLEPIDEVALVHKDGGSDHRLVSASFRFIE